MAVRNKPKKTKNDVYKSMVVGLPKDIYDALLEKSEKKRRSMQSQILVILEADLLNKKDES